MKPDEPPVRLSGSHVGELVRELRPLLVGWSLRSAEALPPRDLLLVLEREERVRRLRLSASPEAARIHVQIGRVRRHEGPIGPFYRAVAEALAGARLEGLEQEGADRIVRLDLAGGPALPALGLAAGARRALVCELVGRHANLLLLDEERRVRAALSVPKAGSRAAERLALGQRWSAPPGGAHEAESTPLARALADPPAPHASGAVLADLAPLSWRVEAALGGHADDTWTEGLRKDLAQRLERRLKNARSNARGLAERARQCAESERVRQDGELLKAALGTFRRGDTEVTVADWFTPESPERAIRVAPDLTPNENVERLFARAQKLERQAARLPEERALAEATVQGLEALVARVASEDPEELEREAIAGGWLKRRQEKAPPARRRAPAARLPYLVFHGQEGGEIRVGRNARDNDTLTFRESRGNDLWLHTADSPGSHVVLRVERGREPHPEDVLDALHLAVHFSPLRGTRAADVHVARCKDVRKPRRAPAGLVELSAGKVRRVRIEPARLARLLDTRRGPGPAPA